MKEVITHNGSVLLGILCLVFYSVGAPVHAQTTIAPGLGTLNETIMADTLSDGSRNETHYILERDGWYIYTEKMKIYFSLTIEAAAGTGARPVIKPYAIDGGAAGPFDVYTGGLTLRGVHIDGYDNSLPAPGLRWDTDGAIRLRGDNVRLVIDDCRLDRCGKITLRADNPGADIFITNSILSNGYKESWPGSSTFLGKSDLDIDTLIVSNTTMYNTGRFNRREGTRFNYTKFEHNTYVNFHGAGDFDYNVTDSLVAGVPQNWGIINMHQSKKLVFRNNLMVNCGFLGYHQYEGLIPQYVVATEMIPVDSVTWAKPDGIDIRNNNIWFDPALATAYAAVGDTMSLYTADRFYDATLKASIDSLDRASSLTNLEVTFANAPRTPSYIVDLWYKSEGGNVDSLFPGDSRIMAGDDMEGTLDFSYTNAALLTASTQGQPLGALNWHGVEMTPTTDKWDAVVVSVDESRGSMPSAFNLGQNYPNPFNPTTTITFDVIRMAHVKLVVYNALGQEVATLVDRELNPNNYVIQLNAGHLSSGIYFYRLETDNFVSTRKMLLLK